MPCSDRLSSCTRNGLRFPPQLYFFAMSCSSTDSERGLVFVLRLPKGRARLHWVEALATVWLLSEVDWSIITALDEERSPLAEPIPDEVELILNLSAASWIDFNRIKSQSHCSLKRINYFSLAKINGAAAHYLSTSSIKPSKLLASAFSRPIAARYSLLFLILSMIPLLTLTFIAHTSAEQEGLEFQISNRA